MISLTDLFLSGNVCVRYIITGMRRVVVTGLGIVCPLGLGVSHVWRQLIAGRSGIAPIDAFSSDDLPCRIAGQVPSGPKSAGRLDVGEWLNSRDQTRIDRFIQLAAVAAQEAVEDAGWCPATEAARYSSGVVIGSGFGGLQTLYQAAVEAHAASHPAMTIHSLQAFLANSASEYVSQRFGLYGPIRAPVSACATGVHAIGDAARLIAFGDADLVLAGASEAAVCKLAIAGFSAMQALSTRFNDQPEEASRPWDKERDGFVMGEGAAVLVMEEFEHARKRGANIHAEFAGYGMSGDGSHITAPAKGHDGAYRAMRAAMKDGRLAPDQIDYVNAHGTSTPLGDDAELEAVERAFDGVSRNLAMSSTKSSVGHLLGAAGAVEAVFTILAVKHGVAPPTINLTEPSRLSTIDRVAQSAQQRHIRAGLCNSFGFGGTNASVIFRAA